MARLPKRRRIGRGERMNAVWWLVCALLYVPVGVVFKLRYRGVDRVPERGGAIMVINHVSHVDPVLITRFVIDAGRVPRFLAKESIFRVPVVGAVVRALRQVPVRRGTADAQQALVTAAEAVRAGQFVVLHPEGTVTRDPQWWPMAGKSGAARLALLVPDAPVIPVGQWGVQEQFDLYHKRVRLIPRPRHAISVGEPVDLSEFRDAPPTPETLRAMTDLIMRAIRDQVAELRGEPAPTGEFFHWRRPE
ncbi:MAG: 1-acyl-sn-glycerol-3-phosphate acyltransferase [Actinomycetia bacterium]|nr:1-acyl-sn-glycerol-3-phosphate acyltransferase [Actinomycetes bacterium]